MGGRGSSMSSRREQAKSNLAAMRHNNIGSMDAPAISSKGSLKMSRLENNISGHQYEIGAVYGKKGKSIVVTTDKAANSVSFSHVQTGKMKNGTLTHNHPSHSGLSSQDVKMATANNLRQIRAVGRNPKTGKNVHHIITRNGSTWKTSSPRSIDRAYSKAYMKEYVRTGSHHKAVTEANRAAAKTVGGKYRTREIKDTWSSKAQKKKSKKVWKSSRQGVLFK